jgi:hypothetical protein
MFPAGFEPATFHVWGERDNRYTTETCLNKDFKNKYKIQIRVHITQNERQGDQKIS